MEERTQEEIHRIIMDGRIDEINKEHFPPEQGEPMIEYRRRLIGIVEAHIQQDLNKAENDTARAKILIRAVMAYPLLETESQWYRNQRVDDVKWLADREDGKAHHTPRNATDPNPSVNELFVHSGDYRSVTLRGESFTLTTQQAQMIELLHSAFQQQTPELSRDYIMQRIGVDSSRLHDSWRGCKDAYRALIRVGRRRGTVALNL